ncbi:MAG: putative toxin-antitoxin system toxin component, PIN family [Bacteroidales bacterium]|nr:putative toxin-antitoxin system toxin component, PIN family [Bacteroidales bacterium]
MRFYAVIDTNVLVSAFITKQRDAATVSILDHVQNGVIIPMYNEEILAEYSSVLLRSKFKLSSGRIKELIDTIRRQGLDCERVPVSCLIPDPDDVVFYEVAMSREDSYLVTGNLKHFPKNVRVVSPADMLKIIALAEAPHDMLCEPPRPPYGSWTGEDCLKRFRIVVEEIRQARLGRRA